MIVALTQAICSVTLALSTLLLPPAGEGPSMVQKRFTDYIDERAIVARVDSPDSVRFLVNEIFDRSAFSQAAASLRDRLFRAELAFRRGEHRAVIEDDLVAAVNRQADAFGAPSYVTTSTEQVRLFRRFMRRLMPHIGSMEGKQTGIESAMSPSEAILVITLLGYQKMTNPEYRVEASSWVAAVKERHAHPIPVEKSPKARLMSVREPKEMAQLRWMLRNDLANEASDVVTGAHLFMDAIGLDR